jgi:glycosyltransferase involved in cell wall biosynthesis
MKIAYLTGEYPKISHTFILREIEALRALEIDVVTASIRKPDPLHYRAELENREFQNTFYVLHSISSRPHLFFLALVKFAIFNSKKFFRTCALANSTRAPGIGNFLWQLFYFLEAIAVAEFVENEQCDHIHNHFGDSSCTVAMLASSLTGKPYSFTVHGPDDFFRPYEISLKTKIEKAAFVVAISNFCRSQLMLFSDPVHWEKIQIVRCGVEVERYKTTRPEGEGKNILFIGRLDGVKGARILIDAFPPVLDQHPTAKLIMVGDGPEREALEILAKDLNVGEAVEFKGFLTQDEVAETLVTADLFVLPSFAEGLPGVLMEAGAASLPLVSTQIAGIPEIVVEGETGVLVPASDVEVLTVEISKLLSQPELRASLGRGAQQLVARDFDIQRTGRELSALFKQRSVTRKTP